jgi:hypothetical protein
VIVNSNSRKNDKIRVLMAKDSRLTFRVGSELKKSLETVALKESRSVAQVCEAFLRAGVMAYHKEGPRYLSRLLSSDQRERQ